MPIAENLCCSVTHLKLEYRYLDNYVHVYPKTIGLEKTLIVKPIYFLHVFNIIIRVHRLYIIMNNSLLYQRV